MDSASPSEKQSDPRVIPIRNDHFSFANVEAWLNIIRSYKSQHPHHQVHITYHGESLHNQMALFKLERPVDPEGFELVVSAMDENMADVTKLFRYLVEGAGKHPENFIKKDVHQFLDLF